MLNSSNIIRPKVVSIRRPPPPNSAGFGFTLRHFIAYPSDDDTAIFIDQASQRKVPLETIFIKEVSPTGPAAFSGLKTGDRVIMVNNSPINGMSYNAIVQMIKTTPDVLYLHVLPKECDVLQMSYGFAHTPESNISSAITPSLHHNQLIEFPHASAAAVAAAAVPQQALVSSHHFTTSTPGTGGMIPIYPHTKHQQPQAQQQQQQQQQHIHKNMISYSDSTYSSIQQRKAMTMSAASSPLSPSSMSSGQQQQQQLQHQLQKQQQQSSSSNEVVYSDINPSSLALRNDGTLIRSAKPPNLTVLQKPNSPDNELMIRLRKSIEQKEEFLKSPVPHAQPTFFNNGNNGCNQSIISRHSLPSSGASSSSLNSTRSRFLYNHPQPPQKSASSLLPASYDMNTFYRQNLPIGLSDSLLAGRGSYDRFTKRISNHQHFLIHNRGGIEENMNRRKFNKDIEYLETLTELGVTNQFFERSSSHLNKGFDPFKQLTINTGSAGHGPLPADSLESLKRLSVNNSEPANSIQSSSRNIRMETHKANLAQTKAEVYAPPKSPAISEEVIYEETIPLQNYKHDVVRRQTVSSLDDNKQLRRISYLRATTGATSPTASIDSSIKRMSYAHEILDRSHDEIVELNGKPQMKDAATEVEIFETEMEIKSSCINGKRVSEYRSWRQVKIEIKGDILKIYPGRSSKTEANVIELDVRNFNILDESVDKKKYVFKLRSISSDLAGLEDDSCKENTEISFKTKSITDMKLLAILREKCATISNNSDAEKQGKQTAEPQKTAATTSTYCDDNTSGGQDYSPTSSTLEQDSISPNPRRKPSKQEKDLGSPKSKSNWKDFFSRKNHGSGTADISPSTLSSSSAKTIGSIGVPLRSCPMSKDNEYVPHIVDVCTKIVESKGLSTTGIYRVPGNKAAISELKEQVNRSDFAWDRCSTDIRWEDVNVVSSLLKQFIRDLPDALLPSTFYINFIEADKKQGERRLLELRYLLKDLPPHSYETMKHIIRHLHRISKNCDVNLMEPKNLAIIFGPSIIRTTNDTLESAVKDMKHQCRIVESLVTNYEFFFEDGELPELDTHSTISSSCTSHHDQTTLLLHNVPKIEQRNHDKESTFKRFMPNLRTRTVSKRSGFSSDTYSGESVLSLEIRKSPDVSSKVKKSSKRSNGSGSSVGSTSGGNEDSKDVRNIELISSPISDYDLDDAEEREENGSTATSNSNENLKEGGFDSTTTTKTHLLERKPSSTGSMSLAAITDTLDTKLKNLRSGSESNDESSIGADNSKQSRPLISYENIPYVDDDQSPERHTNTIIRSKFPPPPTNHFQKPNNYRYSSVYDSFSDDSEVSTTSDPKESLVINPSFLDRYKKRRDYKLFRSASFNCRNYRNGNRSGENNYNCNNVSAANTTTTPAAGGGGSLTKDEKTDMNLTKKRQIQNKQNRSIKRRHTVGGPHDYNPASNNRRKPKPSMVGAKIAPLVAATAKI